MKILDAHVHMDRMAGEDILRMAWGGVEVAIIPSPHLMSGLFYPKTIFELWEKTLNLPQTACQTHRGPQQFHALPITSGNLSPLSHQR